MKTKSVKQSVIDSYGKLASTRQKSGLFNLFSCCDSSSAAQVAEKIGYTQAELASAPEESNLGVGCGNPLALAEIKESHVVLDLGSGAGFDAFLASPLVGDHGKVIGEDLSDQMLALARKNARKRNYTNVEFIKGDIEDLPLEDNSIDYIISNCVINLSQNKRAVYQEAFRVLKRGGKLAISDIILEAELPEHIKRSLAAHIACVSGAERLSTYLQQIELAGFQDICIEKKTPFPIELMLTDPQILKLARELKFDLNSQEAREMASSVYSITITAHKP